jgi:anti-sigma regulatory factor (Ser/Thr protein kinase)
VNSASLRHEAFVYDSDDEFVGQMASHLEDGLAEGATTLAVTTRRNWACLREALGPSAERISFTDRDSCYLRPATAIATYANTLQHAVQGGAPSIRVIAEVQFGPTSQEWSEWTAYEAIANRALADYPAWIVCPYDSRVLPDKVLEDAWRTHPHVRSDTAAASPHFSDPGQLVRALTPDHRPLPQLHQLPPSKDPEGSREQLAAELGAAEVSQASALNVLMAASEILINAWEYADGPDAMRVGLVNGSFVCEISDRGPGLDDPLAGYLPPRPEQERGAGLWVARQLVSRVELISSAHGLTVRLWA